MKGCWWESPRWYVSWSIFPCAISTASLVCLCKTFSRRLVRQDLAHFRNDACTTGCSLGCVALRESVWSEGERNRGKKVGRLLANCFSFCTNVCPGAGQPQCIYGVPKRDLTGKKSIPHASQSINALCTPATCERYYRMHWPNDFPRPYHYWTSESGQFWMIWGRTYWSIKRFKYTRQSSLYV